MARKPRTCVSELLAKYERVRLEELAPLGVCAAAKELGCTIPVARSAFKRAGVEPVDQRRLRRAVAPGVAARHEEILRLRSQGWTYRKIGAHLGVSWQRAHQLAKRAEETKEVFGE